MLTTSSSPVATHHKRDYPFEEASQLLFADSENSYSAMAASASTAQAMKRVRMLVDQQQQQQQPPPHTPSSSRKRSFQSTAPRPSSSSSSVEAAVEQVREEARAQIRLYSGAVENLKQAVDATNADRERLVHDNRILKTGVLKLKSNNDQLQQRVHEQDLQLHLALQRNRMLEAAIIALNANQRSPYASCGNGGGGAGGDFYDRDVC